MTYDPQLPQQPQQPPLNQQPQYAQQQQYGQPPAAPFAAQPQYAPRVPRPNPFAGIPVSDFVRDGGALLLLLVSLALPWVYATDTYSSSGVVGATGRIEVILITLLSAFSLSVTYLLRAGVFPPQFGVRQAWVLRLLLNLPYLLLVVAWIVVDAAHSQSFTGLGYAATLGLAGALLAAQPRAAEVAGLGATDPVARLWHRIAIGYAVAAGLVFVAALILGLVSTVSYSYPGLVLIAGVLTIGFGAAAVLVPLVGIIRGKAVWLTLALALGGSAIAVVLIDAFTGFGLSLAGVESLRVGGYPLLFLGGLLGLAACPALRLGTAPMDPLAKWFGIASTTLILTMAAAGFSLLLVIEVLVLEGAGSSLTGSLIGSIIVLTATIVVAVIARTTLRANPAGSQWPMLGLVALIVVLGIVLVVLRNADTVSGSTGGSEFAATFGYGLVIPFGLAIVVAATTWSLILAFALPAVVIYALTVPAAVRGYYAQYGPQRQPVEAVQPGYAPAGTFPAPAFDPAAAQPAAAQPAVSPTPEVPAPTALPETVAPQPPTAEELQATDPTTSADVLFGIAQNHPELRAQLAANPSTYPDLLAWLAQSPDPDVQAALRARGL